MKKHLYIYTLLILIFVGYNLLSPIKDERADTAVNILLTSILFGYIGYMAYVLLKKLKKNR